MQFGRLVNKRDPIRADDINAIVIDSRSAFRIRCGPGLSARMEDGGIFISLTGREIAQDLIPARITAVTGANPDLPANIRYTAEAVGNPTCKMTAVLPSGGRPVKGADTSFTKLRPAAVGSRCWILQDRDIEGAITPKLLLWPGGSDGECVFFEACT